MQRKQRKRGSGNHRGRGQRLTYNLAPLSLSPPSRLFHNMVLLVTSDNEQFHADKEVVERSVLIKNMLEGRSGFSTRDSNV
jgi:hypothetical protein